jgi:hypothetical protein
MADSLVVLILTFALALTVILCSNAGKVDHQEQHHYNQIFSHILSLQEVYYCLIEICEIDSSEA